MFGVRNVPAEHRAAMEPENEYRRATRGIGLLFAAALIVLFVILLARQALGAGS